MATLRETSSCGIRELHGLNGNAQSSKENIKSVLRTAVGASGSRAHLFFSDTDNRERGGRQLCDTIVAYHLGPVAESVSARNPSSGNNIVGWVWTPDYNAIRQYLAGKLRPVVPGAIRAKGSKRRAAAARR